MAYDAERLRHLSLRARLAIALHVFERYCQVRGLSHVEIGLFSEWLWQFICTDGTLDSYDEWRAAEPALIDTALGYEFPDGFETFLTENKVELIEFRESIGSTAEILFIAIDSKPNNEKTLTYLQDILDTARRYGVEPPDLNVFEVSPWEGSGWGKLLTDEETRQWRTP